MKCVGDVYLGSVKELAPQLSSVLIKPDRLVVITIGRPVPQILLSALDDFLVPSTSKIEDGAVFYLPIFNTWVLFIQSQHGDFSGASQHLRQLPSKDLKWL